MGEIKEFKPKPPEELYDLACDGDHVLFMIRSDGYFVCPICDEKVSLADLVDEGFFA